MSGVIGHMTYAILAEKAAAERKLPMAPIARSHYAAFLAGAYLGCDIQTLPEAICIDTGKEVGYGTVPVEKSPITGGAVRPWALKVGDDEYRPREIHSRLYGRAHLVFGWSKLNREHTVPWDHLPDYLAAVVGDAIEIYGPGERHLAFLFGWMTHIVGDSLIKSIQPGVDLHLLNVKYTRENRPIQDLVTFHDIVGRELGLNWENLIADLLDAPKEPVQLHYMRVTKPRGRLAEMFPDGWSPEEAPLVRRVLAENRRYLRTHARHVLDTLKLVKTGAGLQCSSELSRRAGGLSYRQMVEVAEKANFRHALWQIGEAIADLYEQIIQRQPLLAAFPVDINPGWGEISQRWRKQES